MHLRFSTVHRNGKTYRYAQLVTSYRRADGMPAHRVLANLGAISDAQAANLRLALEAAREGQVLVIAQGDVPSSHRKILANLDYLDVALVRQVWHDAGLAELVAGVLPGGQTQIKAASVIEALVVHRCVNPGSKLSAVRWVGRTALPELVGFSPSAFNNSRVHRALCALEAGEERLQSLLPERLEARQGQFAVLFADITDTWFVGRGPELAHKGRDKEGVYRRRVGIAMLCEGRGLPLKWETLPGNYNDTASLGDLAVATARWPWARTLPFVVDRAMGHSRNVDRMLGLGLRFVTALPANEFPSTGAAVPCSCFVSLDVSGTPGQRKAEVERAAQSAVQAGFTRVGDDRYVMDLGVVERAATAAANLPSRCQTALSAARLLAAAPGGSARQLAAELGCSYYTLHRYRTLVQLSDELQQRVKAGETDAVHVKALAEVAALSSGQQTAAFDSLVQRHSDGPRLLPTSRAPMGAPLVRVRLVAHFNPPRFVEDRAVAADQLRCINEKVDDLNRRLADPTSRRRDTSVLGEVHAQLQRYGLGDAFDVTLVRLESGGRRIDIVRNEDAWARHRRADGLNVVVAHPELPQSAAELVDLYYAKDAIEKDFQTIKSELDLHPVRHRTDDKVRAHVSVCVLALLVLRLLEAGLRKAGLHMTAPAALEELQPCHLNLEREDAAQFYQLTETSAEQRRILSALAAEALVDHEEVRKAITAR